MIHPYQFCSNQQINTNFVAGMAEWLDHSALVQRVVGSKPPSDLSTVRGEFTTLCNSNQKGKKNHEEWSHREERPGSQYSISLPIQWAFCALHINQYPTK